MPATKTYNYQTVDAAGKRSKGTVDAPTEAAAVLQLRQQGAVPISISESGVGLGRNISIPGFGNRVTLKDLTIFTRQFATMNSAGMSMLRSLTILEEQTERPALKKALGEIRTDVEGGLSLSTSLNRHDRIFPKLLVAMVHAGETGGFLDDALERIAGNLEKDSILRAKIKSALTYPVLVLSFSVVMIAAVLIFIVPVFENMFKQFGGALPVPTQIIVTASHTLAWSGPLAIVIAITGTVLFKGQLRRSPRLRLGFDQLKLRLPVLGTLLQKMAISRFSRNLGTLLGVGVPVLTALDIVGATTGNAVIGKAMADVSASVRDGKPISAPLGRNKIFPPMVTQMIEVGEESGQISAMLDKVADFYDREVDSAAESLTASIEPIMVVLMGAIVGGMVVCLYLPMFTIYAHIQGTQ